MKRDNKKICFIANDFGFFFRHFGPAIAAASAVGMDVSAMLPLDTARSTIEDSNLSIIDSPIDRDNNSVISLVQQAVWLARRLREMNPSVIVVYSLRPSLVTALALPFIRSRKVIFCITGLGILEVLKNGKSAFLRYTTYAVLRAAGASSKSHFIFENAFDAEKIGLRSGTSSNQTILMGAGVNLSEFPCEELPPAPPYRFATVSRLIWSKGVDIAVRAASELAAEGYPVELDVYGEPDHKNPFPANLDEWDNLPGVTIKGFTRAIAEVWKEHHAAIFASRGGEGLPRALLEAAACGRPSIVSAVPGCVDFVRDGIDGYVVPPESPSELKLAILRLIANPNTLSEFGSRARERVAQTSTVEVIQSKYESLFEIQTGRGHS